MTDYARWNRTITDAAGNIVNATVHVYRESDGLHATIYSDRAGATPKDNPFTLSNSDYGLAFFHAAGGAYKITATRGSYSETWRWEAVGTAAEYDVGSFVLSGQAPATVFTIAELKALPTATYKAATLVSAGRSGDWGFVSDDYSALVTADTENAKYVKADDTATTAGAWVRQSEDVTPPAAGAVADGSTNDSAKFTAMFSLVTAMLLAQPGHATAVQIPAGDYALSSDVTIASGDMAIKVDPGATFSGHVIDFGNLTKAIGATPTLAYDALFKSVTSDFDAYEHVVGKSIFLKADTAAPVLVSLYSNAEAAYAGSSVFGANIGTYVTAAGTGIAVEFDSHVTHASGLGYAVVIDAIGSYASQAAIIIQANGASSPFLTGISFNNSTYDVVTNNAIQYLGTGSAARYLYAPDTMNFTSAVIETPTFIAGPTVASTTGRLRVDASASGSPKLSAVGSATDLNIVYQAKGTGQHQFSAALVPTANDGAALGTTSLSFSDLFLASGAVLNIAAGNWVATHTSGILTVGTGDLRVTTAGTNAASVVTVGGAQTLTNKTIATPTFTGDVTFASGSITSGGILTMTQIVATYLGGGAAAGSILHLRSTYGVGTTDAIKFEVGNNGATVAGQINTDGSWQFGSPSVVANGSVATALSSVGPTGSHTTVQEWLAVKNSGGTVRYIPLF